MSRLLYQLSYAAKLRGQDSNLRPSGYEPDELPLLHPAFYDNYIACALISQGVLKGGFQTTANNGGKQ